MTYTDDRLNTQPWAYCTLEVYDIGIFILHFSTDVEDDCDSDFPPQDSPIKFTGLSLADAKGPVVPNWQALDNQADHCGAKATVNSPASVTITF